ATPMPNADQLVELARCAVNPTTNEDQILARRVLPTFGASVPLPEWASSRGEKAGSRRGGASRGTGSRSRGRGGDKTAKDPETGTARALCHFRAEMDEEVVLERAAIVEVSVSREALGGALHAAAAAVSEDV